MPAISVISAWAGSTGPALLPDYFNLLQDFAEIVTVDNASADGTAQMLGQMHEKVGGKYIRNETNKGFAAANNQGYALATGDVIVFLNSDVAGDPRFLKAVAADVRDGALYGPSLQYQLVYGMWLPYIEGWCVAGTRGTWDILRWSCSSPEGLTRKGPELGPWDKEAYFNPYWEDSDLCLRAMQAGIALTQTAWPIQHKGGQTAGALIKYGASFERNRATFVERVRPVWEAKMRAEGLV